MANEKMNQDIDTIFTNIFRDSIFKDESIFFRDYLPDKVLCRDNVIKQLSQAFKVFSKSGHHVNIWMTGKPGVGKTTISRFFMKQFEKIIREKTQYKVMSCYYNCFMFRKANSIIYNLLSEKFNQSCRGFETEYLISSLIGSLKRKKINLILILDESHVLGKDLLRILQIGETFEERNSISTIFISREEHERELNALLGTRISNIIQVPPYSRQELYQIIEQRVKTGFQEQVSSDIIDMISKMAEQTGNARLAIEILYQSGKICDLEGQNKLTLDIVRKAKKQVYPQLEEDLFESLERHEVLALLSIMRKLKFLDQSYVSINQAYPQYKIVAEEYKENPYTISTFRTKVKHLLRLGFLEKAILKISDSKDRLGYSVIEIPIEDLENKIKQILN